MKREDWEKELTTESMEKAERKKNLCMMQYKLSIFNYQLFFDVVGVGDRDGWGEHSGDGAVFFF
jgi:hypothetical protein